MKRRQIGRRLHQHCVSWINQYFPKQIQRLLRTGRDENIFDGDGNTHLFGELLRQQLAQGTVPLSRTILQRLPALLRKDLLCHGSHGIDGEHFRSWQATGERDKIGLLSHFQEFPNGRRVHQSRALSKALFPY